MNHQNKGIKAARWHLFYAEQCSINKKRSVLVLDTDQTLENDQCDKFVENLHKNE